MCEFTWATGNQGKWEWERKRKRKRKRKKKKGNGRHEQICDNTIIAVRYKPMSKAIHTLNSVCFDVKLLCKVLNVDCSESLLDCFLNLNVHGWIEVAKVSGNTFSKRDSTRFMVHTKLGSYQC